MGFELNGIHTYFQFLFTHSVIAARLCNAVAPSELASFLDKQRAIYNYQRQCRQDAKEYLHKYRGDEDLLLQITSSSSSTSLGPTRSECTPKKASTVGAVAAPNVGIIQSSERIQPNRSNRLAAENNGSSMMPRCASGGIELNYKNIESCVQDAPGHIDDRIQYIASNSKKSHFLKNEQKFSDIVMPSSLSPMMSNESECSADYQQIRNTLGHLSMEAGAEPATESLEDRKVKADKQVINSVRLYQHRKHGASISLGEDNADEDVIKEEATEYHTETGIVAKGNELSKNCITQTELQQTEKQFIRMKEIIDNNELEGDTGSQASNGALGDESRHCQAGRRCMSENEEFSSQASYKQLCNNFAGDGDTAFGLTDERSNIDSIPSLGSITSSDLGFLISTLSGLATERPCNMSTDQLTEDETNTRSEERRVGKECC